MDEDGRLIVWARQACTCRVGEHAAHVLSRSKRVWCLGSGPLAARVWRVLPGGLLLSTPAHECAGCTGPTCEAGGYCEYCREE